MKTTTIQFALVAFIPVIFFPACEITGSLAYTDPKTGATANLGVQKRFQQAKPDLRADAKRVIPLE